MNDESLPGVVATVVSWREASLAHETKDVWRGAHA
jgi:hypothetical protein